MKARRLDSLAHCEKLVSCLVEMLTRCEEVGYINIFVIYVGGTIKFWDELYFEVVHVAHREHSGWTTVIRIVYYPVLFQSKVDSPKSAILFCLHTTLTLSICRSCYISIYVLSDTTTSDCYYR